MKAVRRIFVSIGPVHTLAPNLNEDYIQIFPLLLTVQKTGT
jgi:hypothetical protein